MPDNRLTQRVVVAIAMIGIALVFILSGREPGWQPFAISGLLAISFLITAFAMPDSSQWIGILALIVLMMTMFWERGRPLAALSGVILAFLNALNSQHSGMLSLAGDKKNDPQTTASTSSTKGE
jgi:Na+/proline symporter